MVHPTQGRLFALMTLLILGTTACGSCDDDKKKPDLVADVDAGVSYPGLDFGTEEANQSIDTRIPVTTENIAPVFRAVGEKGVIPRLLDVQFAFPVIEGGARVVDSTRLVIEPPVEGKLEFTTNSSLRFTPREGFLAATHYTVKLAAVESVEGLIEPETPWTYEFDTPAFTFVNVSSAVFDDTKKLVSADIIFSGAVNPSVVADYVVLSVDGKPVKGVKYEAGYKERVVKATFGYAAVEQSTLSVELRDGFPSLDEKSSAPAAKGSTTLVSGPNVELYAAHRKEGADGFYMEIVCKDLSAPGGTRWYWDRTVYEDYRISRRCLPTAEALEESITFSPPLKRARVASGAGGFNVLGEFERGTYVMTIAAGMKTIDGGILRETLTRTINIPARTPKIEFVNKGRYVPLSGWGQLAVKHMNTPEVTVEVRHVPKRNLTYWLSQSDEKVGYRTSKVVARETIDFKGKTDLTTTSFVDIHNIVGKPAPGVYEVTVGSQGKRDKVRLLVTDMNLIVKRSAAKPRSKWSEELFVWVVDMKTTKSRTGVKVQVIRPSGDPLAECTTDAQGGCRIQVPTSTLDETPPFAVIARDGDEFTYLKYDELKTNPGDSNIHGDPYLAEIPYRATVYSDRGVYRPGEEAHVVAVVRDDKHRAPKAGLPIEIQILDPRRRVLRKFVEKTNEAGVLTFDQKFADFAATGVHDVTLKLAKRVIATYRFNVEEFVPERLEVKANATLKNMLSSATPLIDVKATYLFGGSAEGSPVEATCRIEPSKFELDAYADFVFGRASKDGVEALDLGQTDGELGENGQLRIECPALDEGAVLGGAGQVVASISVFEAGSGRSTVAEAKAKIHPEPFYIGLKTGATKAIAGQSIPVQGVVVDWDGKPYTGVKEVEVDFIRLDREYYWYYDDDEGGDSWGRNIRPVVESTRKVKVGKDGKFTLGATPGQNSSAFVVRVRSGQAVTDVKLNGERRYYYWDRTESRNINTPRPAKATSLVITAPEEMEVGKPAVMKMNIPFKGRVLVTAETHRVITHEWHVVEPGEFEWKLTLGEFAPNIYVSAFLVKDPHLDSKTTFSPDRAFGVTSVKVKPTEHLHTVKITAPEKIEPNSKLDITVDVGPSEGSTFVTVAAVDEGILSLTRFKTPDPSKELFKKRALGVDTFETIGWALKMSQGGPTSRTGGGDDEGDYDDEEGGPGRAMPIKPVALWSGLVEAKNGKAKVSFDVPRYRGALRVMAVAVSPERTGTAEAKVVVRDPLVLQTTLPRFLSAGDEIQIPVFVTNMTGQEGTISVDISAETEAPPGGVPFNTSAPVVELRGASTKTVALAKNESGTVVFAVKGLRQAGVAKFRVNASLGKFKSYDEGIVPFRPSGPRERIVKRVELPQGRTALTSHLDGWVPTSENSTIWVTNIPYGESFDHLKYLVRYPYGCIEQTTSSTRPLLFIGDFIGLVDPGSVKANGSIDAMIAHGIKRVFSMQTAEGGFAYWPGSTYPDAWGTSYATHMLLDAKEQGHEVNEKRLEDALNWLETTAKNLENGRSRDYYRWAEPYMHYVLAKTGRGRKARVQQLIDKLPAELKGQKAEHAYMLKAALYLAGDRRYEKDLKKVDASTIGADRESRWSYYSDQRRRGVVLSTFFDLFGNDAAGEPLAKIIGDSLSNKPSNHYTTQEITWGVTGLGKWIQGSSANFSVPKLYANGKALKPTVTAKKRADRTWAIYRASEYESIEVDMEKADGKVYALVSSSGVRTNSEPAYGGEGIKISRTFYDFGGKEIEPDGHKLGALIYAVIKIENTSKVNRHNLALIDRFAAGFEVENPRLGRGQLPSWVSADDLWNPDHMNIRDDRMEVFGNLSKGQKATFVYAVRAVSAGSFLAPGPEIEGMYDPEVWGRVVPAKVTIEGPWDSYLN